MSTSTTSPTNAPVIPTGGNDWFSNIGDGLMSFGNAWGQVQLAQELAEINTTTSTIQGSVPPPVQPQTPMPNSTPQGSDKTLWYVGGGVAVAVLVLGLVLALK